MAKKKNNKTNLVLKSQNRKEEGLSEEVLDAVEAVLSKRKNRKNGGDEDDLISAIEEVIEKRKSRKDDTGLLEELVGAIVDEAADVIKSRKNDGTLEEVTTEDIIEIVEEIADQKRRKGRKNDDATDEELKDLDTITESDVIQDMAEAVEDIISDDEAGTNDEVADDDVDHMKENDEDEDQKRRKGRKSRASEAANRAATKKTGRSAAQRKYADLFSREDSGFISSHAKADDVPPQVKLACAACPCQEATLAFPRSRKGRAHSGMVKCVLSSRASWNTATLSCLQRSYRPLLRRAANS